MISVKYREGKTKTGKMFSGTLVRLLCCIRQYHNEDCSTKVKVCLDYIKNGCDMADESSTSLKCHLKEN